MSRLTKFLGVGIVFISIVLLITPGLLILLDNNHYTYTIFQGNLNDSIYSFNFSKEYISHIYTISEGRKVYQNYLNIYIDQFIDNTSIENLTQIQLNNQIYTPINKSYEYKLEIQDETLNNINQDILFSKTNGLNITRIDISYYGANYSYYDIYSILLPFLVLLIMVIGLGMFLLSK